mgnify:CR=1 FL=1
MHIHTSKKEVTSWKNSLQYMYKVLNDPTIPDTCGVAISLMDDGPFERNPHYVRLSDPGHGHKHTGLDNEGFFGIGVKKGEEYRFSVWARLPQGGTKENITNRTRRYQINGRTSGVCLGKSDG